MNWYLQALKNYASFSGRARRKEYWYFTLFNFIIAFILGFIDGIVGSFSPEAGIGLLGGIYTLAILIPGLAVSVRRLHDTERSGWWLLIALVPLIGAIVLLVFMVQDSKTGSNTFGENPKEQGA
jgi:uncharacterized membrane protein YhaH (DUF805 family)